MKKRNSLAVGIAMLAIGTSAQAEYLKYTVNYAAKGDTVDTVISITNQNLYPANIEVKFLDTNRGMTCTPHGMYICKTEKYILKRGETAEFATSSTVVPFSAIESSSITIDDSTDPPTTAPLVDAFEGRAEIYSNRSSIQVAAWLVVNGQPTKIPVQRIRNATVGD